VIDAASGLTTIEAENAFALSLFNPSQSSQQPYPERKLKQ